MQLPLVSVITVCYNSESCIAQTMYSVLEQSYEKLEYIIVDGNSQDNTLRIINSVKKEFPNRNITILSEPDNGIYDAMNKAVKLAHGEWLNMMNAGDVFTSRDVLKSVYECGLMNEYSFIYSDFIAVNNGKKRLIKQNYDKGKILHQSSIYKKELHDKYGYYYVTHPYIVSDYLFFLQIPKEMFVKYDMPISMNDVSGVSMQGNWMEYGRISADYMMHRLSETQYLLAMIKRYVINRVKEVWCFFV